MIKKPRLRTEDNESSQRHATWLELFYDLVFVAAIAQIGLLFHHDMSWKGFGKAVFLFLPIWWAWVGHTMYSNRFDTDDGYHRIMTFIQMGAAIFLAATVKGALGDTANAFALAYITIRASFLMSYIRVFNHIAVVRSNLKFLPIGFAISDAIWVVSLFVPAPVKFYLWAIGLFVGIVTPRVRVKKLNQIPVHSSHLPERLGLFMIIVLGEAIVAVTKGVSDVHWDSDTICIAMMGLMLAVSIWWMYFEYLENFIMNKELGAGHLYLYGHLPVYIGLITMSIGIEAIILNDPHVSSSAVRAAISGGFLLFLAPMTYFQMANLPKGVSRLHLIPDYFYLLTLVALCFSASFLDDVSFSIFLALSFILFVIRKQHTCFKVRYDT